MIELEAFLLCYKSINQYLIELLNLNINFLSNKI
jgi:hypothetical protein